MRFIYVVGVKRSKFAVATFLSLAISRGGHSGTYYRYVCDRGQDAVKRSK